jgi:hypothetical protein
MFELHAVQAFQGDCLILVFGTPGDLHYILIDGGPPGTYAQHLRPTLMEIAAGGGRLDRIVLTHTDDDHVTGLVELCAELRSRQLGGQPPQIAAGGMWMNTFAFDPILAPNMAHITIPRPPEQGEPPAPPAAPADTGLPLPLQGVAEAVDLQELVAQLGIPRNEGFPGEVICLAHGAGAEPIVLTLGGLKLTLIGPTQANLDRMGREWRAWLQKHRPAVTPVLPAPAHAPADPDRVAPDQSIPNRSSIMLLAEYEGRRILLTGDGRGDHIVRSLERLGLLPEGGVFHVDILHVPHHGSARNSSRKFFSRVTADTYVFSADGTNGNPDLPTLRWVVETLKAQARRATLAFTNRPPSVAEMEAAYPPADYGYTVTVRAGDQHALPLRLSGGPPTSTSA